MGSKINVVIIEDDKTIREGYAFLIGNNDDLNVVGSFESFDKADGKLAKLNPDVILLDVEMPGTNGVAAIPKIISQCKDISIIMLTVYDTPEIVFTAIKNGANGYLTKNASPEKIISSIKEVCLGGGPMTAQISRLLISSFHKNPNSPLTKRESEILDQFSLGKTRKAVAETLFIDQETVKSHLKNIYLKLDVHSKEQAIEKARKDKLI